MKRSIALLLAWVMMFSLAAPVYAAEGGAEVPQPEAVWEESAEPAGQGEPSAVSEGEPVQDPLPSETAAPAVDGEPSDVPAAEPSQQLPEAVEATAVPEGEDAPAPSEQVLPSQEAEPTAVPEEEAEPTAVPEEEPEPEPEQGLDEEQFVLISDIPAAVGQVDVSVTKALDLGDWTPEFTAVLSDGGSFQAEQAVRADGVCVSFANVPGGDYTLALKGPGFAAYTQNIHVGLSDGVLLKLTAGRLAGYESGAHPGLLQIGDVDGNGTVDGADAVTMMQAVDQQLFAEGGVSALGYTDLNHDGITDLADAEYLAKGLDVSYLDAAARAATEERYIPEAAVAIGAAIGTSASGKENLFKDNGEVFTLERADGGAITPDAPVTMSFDMADGAVTDAILLDDTNILSGYIEITYDDDTTAMAMIGSVPPEAMEVSETEDAPEIAAVPETSGTPENIDVQAAGDTAVPEATEVPEDQQPLPAEETAVPEPAPAADIVDASETDLAPETTETPAAPVDAASEVMTAEVFQAPAVPMASLPEAGGVSVTKDGAGNITVDLGGKRAVKRVTLRITDTNTHGNLASISQVEFVNGMENRIPEPSPDIPLGVGALGASRKFTVTWSNCVNITGYEVEITADDVTEVVPLAGTSLTVTNFNKDDVRNYTTYQVRVRSVNGSWSSDWSGAVSVTPRPTSVPDKPDNVKAEGGYQSVAVSWKAMKDTTCYDLYYKEEGAEAFSVISDITASSYTITGLNSAKPTTYEVYVVGKNEFGSSPESMHASAVTTTPDPADMPRYKLINRDAAGNPGTAHIVAAEQNGAAMVDSPLDTGAGTAWGTVDGNNASYYDRRCWDDGAGNWTPGTNVGLTYTFDKAYTMDTIGLVSADKGMDYTYARVRWMDEQGAWNLIDKNQISSERRTDSQGRTYFFLRLPEPIRTSKLQLGTARYWAGNNFVCVTEVYFYEYDSLKNDIMGLYADDLHTTLREGVTEELMAQLRARIDEADAFGCLHPDRDWLLTEWETANKIFRDQFLGEPVKIHTGITGSGDEHGFGGLNAWQPLGVVAAAGERLTVYVGNKALKTGANTSLELVITQYHAESSAMSKVLTRLKAGANEVQIPKIWTNTGIESGGALYVQYTGGASDADDYSVRVSGGTAVPVLDLYHVTDAGERSARTTAYLAELQAYAANIPALHGQIHQGEGSVSSEVDYDYDEQNCILGATDIMLDTMLLSLPAQQVVSGCGGSAGTLLGSLDAMEQMMALFYQHKGLNAAAPNGIDRIPYRHLNIRYQRMFSGAFMYAAGNHIGIGWNETAGMAGCGGVKATADGLYLDGNYFGWGIAHEIGHDINQSCYAIAEITNNYFAVLAQAKDTNDSVRFDYKNVYAKVTSGAKGSAGNVFTQLAMYWQLHLAYDKGYNFKTYAGYEEQLNNLFFARVDTYARTPDRAPSPGGVALTLKGADVDQTLMRLACAAAEKDLLDFFQRWGKTPDAATAAYAAQFPKETRAIYYVCDDSRRYTMEHGGAGSLDPSGATPAIATVTASADVDQANKVNISIASSGAVAGEEILGYEVVRCTISGGQLEKRPVGFTTERTFADVVYAMNNRTVYYEITLVDKYLNRSAPVTTDAVKIQHEGDLDKTGWTVTTTGLKAEPIQIEVNSDDPDAPSRDPSVSDAAVYVADGRVETVYNAAVGSNASIELDFHQSQVITGFRYTAGGGTPIGGYVVDVCQNGEWQRIGKGELNGSLTVYFSNADGKYVSTYMAEGLRLTLTGQTGAAISVAELDVLGLTGDNVDFSRADGSAAIGYLETDFQYGGEPDDVIPAHSLVFTGSYKGNAAYNVVILYDKAGNVVAGVAADGSKVAYQTIMADVPNTGNIQDTRDGVWIYWIEPEDLANGFTLPKEVRVELYRVNNAKTNEGERLVSDSLFVEVPAEPGSITLSAKG